MPILLVAAVVAGVWYAMARSATQAPEHRGPPRPLAWRFGRAARAAGLTWAASGRRRLSLAEARTLLGVSETATAADIEAAYRRLMLRAHPDMGGSDGLAVSLSAARDLLIKKC